MSHTANGDHAVQMPTGPARVPRSLLVVIVLLLAGLYSYAAFVDNQSAPEKTVEDFYAAYFDRNYDTVAANLSVFWSVRFLPDHQDKTPAQLLADRGQIEQEIAAVIADIEANNTLPEGLGIDILPEYTKIGSNGALVVYDFLENGQPTSREAALLINEKGHFRIFNMSPVDPSMMEEVQNFAIEDLDEGFASLLEPETLESAPTE